MAQEYELTPITPIRKLQREITSVKEHQKETEERILSKLVENNLSTHENIKVTISDLKKIVEEIKGEEEEFKGKVTLATINKKMIRLSEQNQMLIEVINELVNTIRSSVIKKPLPPPPLPPSSISTLQLNYKRTKEV
jgi:hypothetical protein